MTITGTSTSRLAEIKKYKTSGDMFEQHLSSTGSASDGINKQESIASGFPAKIVYYVGGITYYDIINDDGTTITIFNFVGQGYNSSNFINERIIKDPNKHNLVQYPKIQNDVFIDRQQLSVFDKNYKLREINKLIDLLTYAGGRYFNIVSNK